MEMYISSYKESSTCTHVLKFESIGRANGFLAHR